VTRLRRGELVRAAARRLPTPANNVVGARTPPAAITCQGRAPRQIGTGSVGSRERSVSLDRGAEHKLYARQPERSTCLPTDVRASVQPVARTAPSRDVESDDQRTFREPRPRGRGGRRPCRRSRVGAGSEQCSASATDANPPDGLYGHRCDAVADLADEVRAAAAERAPSRSTRCSGGAGIGPTPGERDGVGGPADHVVVVARCRRHRLFAEHVDSRDHSMGSENHTGLVTC